MIGAATPIAGGRSRGSGSTVGAALETSASEASSEAATAGRAGTGNGAGALVGASPYKMAWLSTLITSGVAAGAAQTESRAISLDVA